MPVDFIVSYAWLLWLGLVLVFVIIEVVTVDFTFLMIALGIIGEYVANIYREVKRRPRYVVGRTLTDRVPPRRVTPEQTGETVPPVQREHSDA